MATLKHINSKNADYGAAEQYLLFEHDEFTMKPVLDETGRLIPREDYRLSTLNCGGEDFAVACMRANLRYGKNQRREDVKSHHYIISFDPRDGPDRTKPITARKLGDDFDRAAVLAVLERNAARAAEKAAAIPEYPRHGKTGIQPTKAPQTAPKQDGVQRLVDIEQKMAEGKGKGYEHWAKIHNIKQMAKTLNVYQEYGFTSPEQLEVAFDTAYEEMRQTSGELKTLETKLQGKKELQRQVLAYAKTKPVRDGLKAQKSPKAREAYRQAHESDFIIADAVARYFKAHGITRLPARKALQDEIEQLVSKKSGLYNTYHEQKQRFKELQTVKRNIDQILRREEPRRRKEQSHER